MFLQCAMLQRCHNIVVMKSVWELYEKKIAQETSNKDQFNKD